MSSERRRKMAEDSAKLPSVPETARKKDRKQKAAKMNYVYLLQCADGSYYCGWTTDPMKRTEQHNRGRGAKYTRSRLPVALVYCEAYEDRHEALSREWHLKRLSREEKKKLIRERGTP